MIAQFAIALALVAGLSQTAPAQQKTPEQAAKEARLGLLLKEAAAAQTAGNKTLMFAKLEQAATLSKNSELMHKVGHFYEQNTDVTGFRSRADHWFLEAAELGHGEALSHVAKRLDNEAALSDADYSAIVEALDEGSDHSFSATARNALGAIAKKHEAAAQCARDVAKRLGYVADETDDLIARGRPREWYKVRRGSGAASGGDRLTINAADPGAMFASLRYARLSLDVSGFSGIETKILPVGKDRSITMKDYTGYEPKGSAEGRRDAQIVLATCKPR